MRALLLCLFLFSCNAYSQQDNPDMQQSVVLLIVKVSDFYGRTEEGKVTVVQYRPNGPGPFPIVLLNHGRNPDDRSTPARFYFYEQARFFVERGFAVFVPTRIGYGENSGNFDPENNGSCANKQYAPMAEAASTEILAVLDYAKQQPYADPKRVLLVGQSVGGYATTAAAARNPDGLIAAINFAGGSGGDPVRHPGVPCVPDRMEAMYRQFGATTKVPMLWIYTQNDQYFNPTYSQAWHAAFVDAGGQAEYHLLPAFARNGHTLFSNGTRIWSPVVAEFLGKVGFSAEPVKH
jgi:dienelactone hydrolase